MLCKLQKADKIFIFFDRVIFLKQLKVLQQLAKGMQGLEISVMLINCGNISRSTLAKPSFDIFYNWEIALLCRQTYAIPVMSNGYY